MLTIATYTHDPGGHDPGGLNLEFSCDPGGGGLDMEFLNDPGTGISPLITKDPNPGGGYPN